MQSLARSICPILVPPLKRFDGGVLFLSSRYLQVATVLAFLTSTDWSFYARTVEGKNELYNRLVFACIDMILIEFLKL